MLSKRIIPCLDVRAGKLTKGVKFQNNIDIGDPVKSAIFYANAGADEIVFYDITASAEGRGLMLRVVEKVAENIFIPFSVGGGISTVQDMRDALLAGAEKISINSAAVQNPRLISDGAAAFGDQCIVVGMDILRVEKSEKIPSGYEIVIHGGRKHTRIDALWWAKEAQRLGAGELCLNSIDADGIQNGYEIELTQMIAKSVRIPVIASGGAGKPSHLAEVLTKGQAQAALIASMVHFGKYTISEIKKELTKAGITVRPTD